jgi:hypothetical protein
VRALCRSIRKFHPEAMIHLVLADERPAWLTPEGEPFDAIMEIDTLGIPKLRGWTFTHGIVELSTAIKPFALRRLLERPDCKAAVYFDPDMVLFSRVDDILATLETSNVALTPHQTKPEKTLENVIDNEITSLAMGVFNLGFIGVANTAEGRRFAEWWSERTYHFCRAEVANGLFTDQKWINFAPIFFDGVAILKSSRHNVATWNITTRLFTGNVRDGFKVDGEPLGFYPLHRIRQRRAPADGDQERVGQRGAAGADRLVREGDRFHAGRPGESPAVGVREFQRRLAGARAPPLALPRPQGPSGRLPRPVPHRHRRAHLHRVVQHRGPRALSRVLREDPRRPGHRAALFQRHGGARRGVAALLPPLRAEGRKAPAREAQAPGAPRGIRRITRRLRQSPGVEVK